MAKLVCDIVTPARKLFSEEVYLVTVPGSEGEMGFLQGHEPLVAVLADGAVRIQCEKESEILHFVLQGGYVEVTGEKIIILADKACSVADVEVAHVQEELAALEAELAELPESDARKATLAANISWCKTQIHGASA